MPQGAEKRRCHRFEIPGGQGRYKRTGMLILLKGYSKACPVTDVSKGGLSFGCHEAFKVGQKIIVQLVAPDEEPLDLHARVRRQVHPASQDESIVGVEFAPFGSRRGWNSIAALDVLRRLDKQYGPDARKGASNA